MNPKLEVGGIDIEWREEDGLCLWAGAPVMTAWIESTMAGLLTTVQRMVGAERFELAMQQGGRDSIDGDWRMIASAPTFEEGFERLIRVAAAAGWGRWQLVSVDLVAREARVRVYNNWESVAQRALGVSWGASFVAGKLSGIFQRHFGVPTCWAEQTLFAAEGDAFDEFVIRPSDRSLEARLDALFQSDQVTKADLAVALERVRREVEERTQAEHALREKLDLIAQQEEAIRALSTPIIEVWDGVLTLPLFGAVDTRRAAEMMERLLDAITHKGARVAIIDLTGVDAIDAETADHIGKLVRAAELVGAKCTITGIRPAVAQTMVEIGIDLTKIATLSTLREALRRCMRPSDLRTQKNS
ncbi:STAS domain-containing protein [Polyangium sorediatum]|uniref:STAS domain-containing protein n=1 Tax=Polyangium sorediatum TaxID=889274 RepID=A0ABT6NY89_9BACT|nr:STAS domain-containing protein [Polyangium sorediatum]MDI1433040.1 STAS domain-containing protein [Polyangium sorediatum]